MKRIIIVLSMLLLSVTLVSAIAEEGRKLVNSGIDCNKLSDEQLEAIGDYYMEQMHPGEAHEIMDNMMGGEGSESLRQVHINMAKRLYCDADVWGANMMSGNMMGKNMMGSGEMMNMMSGNMMQGMMGNWEYGLSYGNYANTLYIILLIGLIILAYLWIIKSAKNSYGGKK